MAKQRIRNKMILAFFAWVEAQPAEGSIDNRTWEACAVGKFVPTIGLSLEGDHNAQLEANRCGVSDFTASKERDAFLLERVSGRKFLAKLRDLCPDFYETIQMTCIAPRTYGALNDLIKASFTK